MEGRKENFWEWQESAKAEGKAQVHTKPEASYMS